MAGIGFRGRASGKILQGAAGRHLKLLLLLVDVFKVLPICFFFNFKKDILLLIEFVNRKCRFCRNDTSGNNCIMLFRGIISIKKCKNF